MSSDFFDAESSLLLVVDVQERLWPLIANKEQVRDRCAVMMRGAQLLGIPALISEQYPKGLGRTLPELLELRTASTSLCEKTAFGCLEDQGLARQIEDSGHRRLVVCGIETHICVLQTALGALERGYHVGVVSDAVGSRDEQNRSLALARMRRAGAAVLSSEMILFEWMRDARHPSFKAVSALIK